MVWAVLLGKSSPAAEGFAQLYSSQVGGLGFGLLVGAEEIFHGEVVAWQQDSLNP